MFKSYADLRADQEAVEAQQSAAEDSRHLNSLTEKTQVSLNKMARDQSFVQWVDWPVPRVDRPESETVRWQKTLDTVKAGLEAVGFVVILDADKKGFQVKRK